MPNNAKENYEPFVGPRPFGSSENDQQRFKGRFFETKRIISYLRSQKVTLLYAPSGTGKTSLINASVIPELERKKCDVLPVTRIQITTASNQYLEQVKNKYVFNAILRMLPPEVNPEDVINETLSSFIEKFPKQFANNDYPIPRIFILDQFEEIFTVPTVDWADQREDFFKQVADALDNDSSLRVMFIIREEYVGQIEKYGEFLPNGFTTRFRLNSLTAKNAELALSEPLKNTNRKFETGVAEKIVADMSKIKWTSNDNEIIDIQGDTIEPVHLQLVGSTLWENLPKNVTSIKHSDIKQYGDVDKILLSYYENELKNIIKTYKINEKKLRAWVDSYLITPAGTRSIVFRDKETTKGLNNKIIDALSNSHIIRGDERSSGYWYELSHDRWIIPIKKSNAKWRQTHAKKLQKRYLASLSVIFLILFSIGGFEYSALNRSFSLALNNNSIVPTPKTIHQQEVKKFPGITYNQFNVKRDIRIIDLRSRIPLTLFQTKHGGKYSPVTWTRYTIAKKKKKFLKSAPEMVFRFATSGFDVIPRSLTHPYHFQVSTEDKDIHHRWINVERRIIVDVSKEKENDFLVTTEATFWNAFQGEKEWASITPVDKGTQEIGISLIFPKDNIHSEIVLRKHHKTSKSKYEIIKINTLDKISTQSNSKDFPGKAGEDYKLLLDGLNRTVYWQIKNPDADYRYDVGWTWDQGMSADTLFNNLGDSLISDIE